MGFHDFSELASLRNLSWNMVLRSLRILRELDRIQYLPIGKLEALQSARLRAIVAHAYGKVRYYRELFDAVGIKPSHIKDIRDIHRIPVTTKKDLQERTIQELLSQGVKAEDCVVKHTSGSTGLPLRFLFGPQERDFQSLLNLRIFLAGGFKFTDKTAYLINPNRFPKGRYWFQNFGILRRYYLSVFDDAEIHHEALNRIKPDIIYGYPSNLTLLALLIKERGIDGLRPKAVFSSAEVLESRPRELIASAMDTNVYDILGLVETGDIGWECPTHEGYHMNSDAVIMEFLDEKGESVKPGQPGKLVCTSLYSYTMPLIRYDAGDICVPSNKFCSCGRTLPLMESIKGRANDFIVLPDGKIIASCFLVIVMQDFHDVAQYKIIQKDPHGLVLYLVKGKNFNGLTINKVIKSISEITNGLLKVRVKIVDEIVRDNSGKIRAVTSEIIPDFIDRL